MSIYCDSHTFSILFHNPSRMANRVVKITDVSTLSAAQLLEALNFKPPVPTPPIENLYGCEPYDCHADAFCEYCDAHHDDIPDPISSDDIMAFLGTPLSTHTRDSLRMTVAFDVRYTSCYACSSGAYGCNHQIDMTNIFTNRGDRQVNVSQWQNSREAVDFVFAADTSVGSAIASIHQYMTTKLGTTMVDWVPSTFDKVDGNVELMYDSNVGSETFYDWLDSL